MKPRQANNDPPVAKAGDTVRIHFTCRLEDGSVFATTREREPKEFVLGASAIIPGLQEAVVGMSPGGSKTVRIEPAMAYGPYHEEMTAWLDRSAVPAGLEIEAGRAIRVKHADGKESDAFVTEIDGERIKVDGNHPLAGKALVMDVELVEVLPT